MRRPTPAAATLVAAAFVIALVGASRAVGADRAPAESLARHAGDLRPAVAGATLACAEGVVATWPLARVVNETISVSVSAQQIGAMAPAARAGYGALLLFGTTAPAGFASTVATLQRETPAHEAMLIMSDQEGGGVERLTNLIATLPWAQTMGKNLTAAQITAEGIRVGRSMIAAGVNTDLAPVLDVDGRAEVPSATNPDGYRSFSGVAAVAATDGVAFAKGLTLAGVTAVVKHYPGLGGASGNTDYGPAATRPWSVLQSGGLVPFERALRAGVGAVMVSNATVPGLSALPASVSPVVIATLRQRLGFNGLIMTDALSAGAISAVHLSVPAASVRAISAGVDLVLNGSPTSAAASLAVARATSLAIERSITSGALALSTVRLAAAEVLATRNAPACVPGAS